MAIFMAIYCLLSAKDIRLSNPRGLLYCEVGNFSWSRLGGDSLSYLHYIISFTMTKRDEICNEGKNSIFTATSAHETCVRSIVNQFYPEIKRLRIKRARRCYVIRGKFGPRSLYAHATMFETAWGLFMLEIGNKVIKEPVWGI
jgi:hypothetical protein